jgi:hypothetical protein
MTYRMMDTGLIDSLSPTIMVSVTAPRSQEIPLWMHLLIIVLIALWRWIVSSWRAPESDVCCRVWIHTALMPSVISSHRHLILTSWITNSVVIPRSIRRDTVRGCRRCTLLMRLLCCLKILLRLSSLRTFHPRVTSRNAVPVLVFCRPNLLVAMGGVPIGHDPTDMFLTLHQHTRFSQTSCLTMVPRRYLFRAF